MLDNCSKNAVQTSGVVGRLKGAMLTGAKAGNAVSNFGMDMTASITDGITGTNTASKSNEIAKQIPDAFFAPFKRGGGHHL